MEPKASRETNVKKAEDTKPDTPERRAAMAELVYKMSADVLGERILRFVEQAQASPLPREALVWQLSNVVTDLRAGERLRIERSGEEVVSLDKRRELAARGPSPDKEPA